MVAYQKGTLISWNDDRGFGFIDPGNGAKTVFLHISALKKEGRRPQEGDTIVYQLTMDNTDRVQASHAYIAGVHNQRGQRHLSSGTHAGNVQARRIFARRSKTSKRRWGIVVVLIALFMLWQRRHYFSQSATTIPVEPAMSVSSQTQPYRCEGKIHCSAMTSCEEALYYLRNCPGVEIDGDGDGIPCESQWCGQ